MSSFGDDMLGAIVEIRRENEALKARVAELQGRHQVAPMAVACGLEPDATLDELYARMRALAAYEARVAELEQRDADSEARWDRRTEQLERLRARVAELDDVRFQLQPITADFEVDMTSMASIVESLMLLIRNLSTVPEGTAAELCERLYRLAMSLNWKTEEGQCVCEARSMLEHQARRIAELEAKVADAVACFEIECPCCGQNAASWAVSDGDSLECGCDGYISCCSETYPYANVGDCGCGGDGYPKTDPTKDNSGGV